MIAKPMISIAMVKSSMSMMYPACWRILCSELRIDRG
jgi:hypothetical protein